MNQKINPPQKGNRWEGNRQGHEDSQKTKKIEQLKQEQKQKESVQSQKGGG